MSLFGLVLGLGSSAHALSLESFGRAFGSGSDETKTKTPAELNQWAASPAATSNLVAAVHALGYPTLPADAQRAQAYGQNRFAYRGGRANLARQSNAWLYETDEEEKWILFDTGALQRIPSGDDSTDDGRIHLNNSRIKRDAFWKEVLSNLQEWGKEPDSIRYRINRESWSSLIFAAVSLYDIGEEEKAALLIGVTLHYAKAPDEVALLCLNHLADQAYSEALARFYTHKDWAKLADETEAVIARFPEGWANAPQAQKLVARYRARHLVTTAPPVTPPQGWPWKPAFSQIADQMFAQSAQYVEYFPNSAQWFSRDKSDSRASLPKDSWEKALHDLGPEAVAVLVACATDSTLVATPSPDANSYRSSYGDDQPPTLPLSVPATRSELALAILLRIIPEMQKALYDGDLSAANRAQIAVAEANAWKERVDLTDPKSLLVDLFEQVEGYQQLEVAKHLLAQNDPDFDKRVVALILNPPNEMTDSLRLASHYAAIRGESARPTIAEYIKRTREELGDGEGLDDDWAKRQHKEHLKQLESLEKVATAKTLDQIIADLAAGKTTYEKEKNTIATKLQVVPEAEHESHLLLLAAALQTNRTERIQVLFRTVYGRRYASPEAEASDDGPEASWAATPPALQAAWKTLIAADRTDLKSTSPVASIGLINRLNPKALSNPYEIMQSGAAHPLNPYILAHAEALVQGTDPKEAPAVPSAKSIDAAARETALTALQSASTESVTELFATWNLSMRMAMWDAVEEADAGTYSHFPPGARAITRIFTDDTVAEYANRFTSFEGAPLNTATFEQITQQLNRLRDDGVELTVSVGRIPYFNGFFLYLASLANPEYAEYLDSQRLPYPSTRVMLSAETLEADERIQSVARWIPADQVAAAKAAADAPKEALSDDDIFSLDSFDDSDGPQGLDSEAEQAALAKQLEKVFAPTYPITHTLTIQWMCLQGKKEKEE